jgi:hypothetical protein
MDRRSRRILLSLATALVLAAAAVGLARDNPSRADSTEFHVVPVTASESCPSHPESLLPPGQETGGVSREEADAYRRAYECGYEPPAGSGAVAPPPAAPPPGVSDEASEAVVSGREADAAIAIQDALKAGVIREGQDPSTYPAYLQEYVD